MQQKNYYILLEVSNTASYDELKIAYRTLAKKYHPDKNPNSKTAEEYFKEIQQAYTILSNPEKRKKYDLKLSSGNTNPRQRSYTQYTGNAYQYAQQQAQSQSQQQNYTTRKAKAPKHDKTESLQIPISIGIALLLLYFIISYSDRKTETLAVTNSGSLNVVNQKPMAEEEKSAVPMIRDFDSPYSGFFGEEIANEYSKNNINIHNSDESEAIVCLVENKKTTTIRNQYMNMGSSFKMNNIPDGEYFLKVYYGTNWDTIKTFLDNKVKGGFLNEINFVELKNNNKFFKMTQELSSSGSSFSSYEIYINPSQKKDVKIITAEQFFK